MATHLALSFGPCRTQPGSPGYSTAARARAMSFRLITGGLHRKVHQWDCSELCPPEGQGRAALPSPAPQGPRRQRAAPERRGGSQRCKAERGALPADRVPGPARPPDPRPLTCSSAPRGPRAVASSLHRTFPEGELASRDSDASPRPPLVLLGSSRKSCSRPR